VVTSKSMLGQTWLTPRELIQLTHFVLRIC